MSVTAASRSGPASDVSPAEYGSRLRRLLHLYISPGDHTPMWASLAIGLLAIAGLVVLGTTSQLWLLACTGLLVYAVIGVTRPLEAWRILHGPAGPPARPRRGDPPVQAERPSPDGDENPDPSGWLPTRRAGRR